MIEAYLTHVTERAAMGIPPLPLSSLQVAELCALLESPPASPSIDLLDLLSNRVAPGVDPAAQVKADWLGDIALARKTSPLVKPDRAVHLLGTMLGGYNIRHLLDLLDNRELGTEAARALSHTILVYDGFEEICHRSKANPLAMKVLTAWANGDWFTSRPELPHSLSLTVYKVEGEINTDDFSPAGHAWSRADIPLHACSMGESRFPTGPGIIADFRRQGKTVAFVGDVVGTGSSRKSACNSLMWHIGQDIPHIPNKRRGGIIIGGLIAPIFFNTTEDSGGLPLTADVSPFATGDEIELNMEKGTICSTDGKKSSRFSISPATLLDEFRAGGRLNLIIGRTLTARAREVLDMDSSNMFVQPDVPVPSATSILYPGSEDCWTRVRPGWDTARHPL